MHDTPPPTKFDDGSFSSQVKEELDIHPASGRFLHRCVPTDATAPFIAHVKVIKGNGDAVYWDEDAADSVIKIELANDDDNMPAGDLKIEGGADFFQIDSDSRFRDPTPGAKHRKRYEHPGKGKSFHISRIVVEKPAGTVRFDRSAPDEYEEEFSVMVWHIGDDHHMARD